MRTLARVGFRSIGYADAPGTNGTSTSSWDPARIVQRRHPKSILHQAWPMSKGGQPLGQNQQPPDNFNDIVNTKISPHQQGGGTTRSIPATGEQLQPSHSSNSSGVGVVPSVPQSRTSLPDVRSYVQHLVSKKWN